MLWVIVATNQELQHSTAISAARRAHEVGHQIQSVAAKYLRTNHSVTGYLLPSEPVQN